jgi:mevalonate pyrophosphate decarboxylase
MRRVMANSCSRSPKRSATGGFVAWETLERADFFGIALERADFFGIALERAVFFGIVVT